MSAPRKRTADAPAVEEDLIRALCYLYCEAMRHRRPALASAIEAAITVGRGSVGDVTLLTETADALRQVGAVKGFAALGDDEKRMCMRFIEQRRPPPAEEG
jgi:hypothetical protein